MKDEKQQKKNIKIKNDKVMQEKKLDIQDSSLDVNSEEERSGVGLEIFGVPGKP